MKDIAARFTHILGWLSQAVATFVARQVQGPRVVILGTQTYVAITPPSPHSTIPIPTWLLLTTRLGRLAQRFRALVARVEAGHVAKPSLPRSRTAPLRPASPRPATSRLPTERGWINARVPEAAPCAGTLLYLLQDPDMPAFIARAPQAGRLLRPICRALAVDLPDWLRLTPRPRRPAPRHPEQSEGPTLPKRSAQARPLQRQATLPVWYPAPPRTRKSSP